MRLDWKSGSVAAVCLAVVAWFVSPFCTAAEAPQAENFDVVVYGATPAGVAAAVNAAREGMRTALVQEDGHIGGLASGGLSNTDFKSFESLGGTFREFMLRVKQHYIDTYGQNSQEVIDCVEGGYYEPGVARRAMEAMLNESGVTVLLHHRLAEAIVVPIEGTQQRRLTEAVFTDLNQSRRRTLAARVFIDGTYEGDLIAAAGVEYRVGCESKDEYGESMAFDEANSWVQTYNFRVCLTSDPKNRIPLPKPDNYDPAAFELLREGIRLGVVDCWSNYEGPKAVLKVRKMANHKADFNDMPRSPISLSIKNINHAWPEGSPEVRWQIYETYKRHSLALFWFLAHDPAVPESWRKEMQRWGLPRDEYVDTGHWSPALYVREGRRMVGAYVFTQHDTQPEPGSPRSKLHRDSVAIGDYSINCHGVYSPEPGVNIGAFGKSIAPYQIPYRVLLPKDVEGLLSPVAVSASHVGYCAIRMEPSWTALGQAAGLAAAQSIRDGCALRDVDVIRLQWRLHDLGAMTVYISDVGTRTEIPRPEWDPSGGTFTAHLASVPPVVPYFQAAQFFGTHGFFHDLIPAEELVDQRSRDRSTGQWSVAFANHDLKPERLLDRELATRWIDRAGQLGWPVELNADQLVQQGITRGEFLNRLLEQVRAHHEKSQPK